jgi:RIO-like serine/threonine protein kinase
MATHTKIITYGDDFIEQDAENEVELQEIASKYNFVPKIINTKFEDERCVIEMEDLEAPNLANIYGENIEDIPDHVWNSIRIILKILLEEEGIEYIDITPYNFIEKDGKVYIIDFGHAYYTDLVDINPFLNDVLYNDLKSWNPDFK